MEGQFDRFKEAPWFPKNDETVVIGGAGGIGSWLSFLLARTGFSIVLYDYDFIEHHNLGGQLFRTTDVGRRKVDAVRDIVRIYCGDIINTFPRQVSTDMVTSPFMFSAFDNMDARKTFFEAWKRDIDKYTIVPMFIDGRLTMEQLQIFCVTPDNIDEYEKHLFDDSEVEDEPCTMKQTSHTAAMIASHMVAFFTNHITNVYEREKIRNIPFFFEYFVPMADTNSIEL